MSDKKFHCAVHIISQSYDHYNMCLYGTLDELAVKIADSLIEDNQVMEDYDLYVNFLEKLTKKESETFQNLKKEEINRRKND